MGSPDAVSLDLRFLWAMTPPWSRRAIVDTPIRRVHYPDLAETKLRTVRLRARPFAPAQGIVWFVQTPKQSRSDQGGDRSMMTRRRFVCAAAAGAAMFARIPNV